MGTALRILSTILPVAWKWYTTYQQSKQKKREEAIRKDPDKEWNRIREEQSDDEQR